MGFIRARSRGLLAAMLLILSACQSAPVEPQP